MIVVYTLLYLYAFWCVYIAVMGLYRAHLNNTLHGVAKWLAYPLVAVGIVIDVLANVVIAPFVFFDMPHEWLVTDRLVRYIKTDKGWRSRTANWVCTHLLDVFDPTGVHCK